MQTVETIVVSILSDSRNIRINGRTLPGTEEIAHFRDQVQICLLNFEPTFDQRMATRQVFEVVHYLPWAFRRHRRHRLPIGANSFARHFRARRNEELRPTR